MGWAETSVMESRAEFCIAAHKGDFTMTELCAAFGISRKTGYKWLRRYREEGLLGLEDRSRAPHNRPLKTPDHVRELIIDLRDSRPTWGAKKLKARLKRLRPELDLPACSTIHDILKREGRVQPRAKRRKHAVSQPPRVCTDLPNEVWCTDFKGEFPTLDGTYCYPLTVTDWASRYLLACHGLTSVAGKSAREVFEQLFDAHGLPRAILSDNGVPFAHPNALCRLSSLSVWWMKLGIEIVRTQPSHPEQNGRHERMHRTLKAETTRPAGRNLDAQQLLFDAFRQDYNEVRPHEALGLVTPAEVYEPRAFELRGWSGDYPAHFRTRKIHNRGDLAINGHRYNLTSLLSREYVGLEEIDDGQWNVYFRDYLIARVDELAMKLYEVGPTPVRVTWD